MFTNAVKTQLNSQGEMPLPSPQKHQKAKASASPSSSRRSVKVAFGGYVDPFAVRELKLSKVPGGAGCFLWKKRLGSWLVVVFFGMKG